MGSESFKGFRPTSVEGPETVTRLPQAPAEKPAAFVEAMTALPTQTPLMEELRAFTPEEQREIDARIFNSRIEPYDLQSVTNPEDAAGIAGKIRAMLAAPAAERTALAREIVADIERLNA